MEQWGVFSGTEVLWALREGSLERNDNYFLFEREPHLMGDCLSVIHFASESFTDALIS